MLWRLVLQSLPAAIFPSISARFFEIFAETLTKRKVRKVLIHLVIFLFLRFLWHNSSLSHRFWWTIVWLSRIFGYHSLSKSDVCIISRITIIIGKLACQYEHYSNHNIISTFWIILGKTKKYYRPLFLLRLDNPSSSPGEIPADGDRAPRVGNREEGGGAARDHRRSEQRTRFEHFIRNLNWLCIFEALIFRSRYLINPFLFLFFFLSFFHFQGLLFFQSKY